ncbi:MAG TPA: hypothetical protein VIV27_02370, partial [Halioglobus sp.]
TLRAEGRNVAQIDGDLDESDRCFATLAAMRAGADFIINGQLAVDNLSGHIQLLMRTSGFSLLGDYLYVPCDTYGRETFQTAFRLCFAAELLQSLQDQLPPQMLIIRNGAEVVPVQTEDYIYFYRAVQTRFIQAMSNFRKHRMPDPAESSHFGRWSECASEVLRQRALREQHQADVQQDENVQEDVVEMPQIKVASNTGTMRSHYDMDVVGQPSVETVNPISATLQESSTVHRGDANPTLAEQALALAPGSYRRGAAPGHTPNLARFGHLRPVTAVPDTPEQRHNRRSSDAALQNLEFIGSSPVGPRIDIDPPSPWDEEQRPAPLPNLREIPKREVTIDSGEVCLSELDPRPPLFLPPDNAPSVEPPPERLKLHPLDDGVVAVTVAHSMIDMDSAPAPTLAPVVERAEAEFERLFRRDFPQQTADPPSTNALIEEDSAIASPFSNSLHTSREFKDF